MSKADQLLKRVEFYEKMASSSSQKPETNELLDKVALFERLALYSDRKSFLEAVAQTRSDEETNRRLIWQALQIMQNAGVDEATTQPLGQAVTFNKVDIAAIKKAIQDAILTGKMSPLSHGPEIQKLKDISSLLISTPISEEQLAGAITFPDDVSDKKLPLTPTKQSFPPIKPEDQQALLQFVTEEGVAFVDPKKMNDGLLGPETRKALEGVKNYFAKLYPQNPRMTDQQAITAAKAPRRQ